MLKKLYILFSLILAISIKLSAQTYPVSVSIVMPFPQPIYLSDYYAATSNSMQINLKLNDYSISNLDVKIKIEIDNGSVNLKTKNNYTPTSFITLTPGVPLLLQGSDLYDALNINNMDLSGISANYLNQNGGKLPEGQYTFCVTVLDANLNKEISSEACNIVFLNSQQAPSIVSPDCGAFLQPSNPQQLNINWQLSGGGQPSMSGLNTFKVILYEVTTQTSNPANAVANSQAMKIYESNPTTLNTFNLDFSTVLLEAGKQYVFRVQGMGPNGKQVFENDGYSEWCWFNYGYPTGGTIELDKPYSGKQFEKTDQKVFSWGASDKGVNGQAYKYKIKIVIQDDTTQTLSESIANATVFHEETLNEVSSQDGSNFLLNKELTPDKKYVWAIEAYSGGQKVAESDARVFYSHSLIERFYASNREIEVIQITNADLENLAGKARIGLSEDEQDFIDVNFSNIKIKDVSGQMIMYDGEISFDLSSRTEMELTPELEDNGSASFEYISGKINKDGLTVQGKMKWLIPHAVLASESQEVISKASVFVMDSDGKLSGEAGIEAFSTILISPKDFILNLKETSILQLSKNKFTVKVIGGIKLPEEIKTLSGNPIYIEFKQFLSQLNYIEIDNLIGVVSEGVAPLNNFKMEFIPLSDGVIDLSESKSPAKLSADKAWKGFYITGYKIRLHSQNLDQSNQLTIESRIDHNETTDGTDNKFWISGAGLTLNSELDLTEDEGVKFNTFKATTIGTFEFKKSILKEAIFEGYIKIPFVGDAEKFTFEISATTEGLEEGFLNEDLTKRNLEFNPFGVENKMNVKINRAVFTNNEWISMNLDVDIPEVGSKIESIEDFRVYGDNFIGVGGKNKSYTLDNFVEGKFKNLDFTITEFGAAYLGGSYALSYSAETSLSEGFAGKDGPPILAISSVMETTVEDGDDLAIPPPEIEVPDGLENETSIKPAGIDLVIKTAIIDGDAKLLFTNNDPKWGTKFEGGINVKVKIPMALNFGTNLTLGITQDNMDYWYFDAYFEDKSSTGIPVYEPISLILTGNQIKLFNITGMEGKIFRHMKATQENGKMSLDLAEDVMFGMGLYAQIIDGDAKGFIFQADLGIETELKGKGFTPESMKMSMSGEASFLNFNIRTGVNLKEVTAEVAAAATEEVMNLAADAIFPIGFDINNTNYKLKSTGFDNGELEIGNYNGGDGFVVGANVSSKPSAKIGFAKDGVKFGGSADASGSGSFDFKVSNIDIAAKMNQMNSGSFDLNIDGLALDFGADIDKKIGNFGFEYSNTKLLLGFNAPLKKGMIDVDISGVKFNSSINVPQKSASIGFDIQSNKFDMSFNGLDKKASLLADISGIELSTSFDMKQKKGQLYFETSSEKLDLFGSPESANFKLESGSKLVDIENNFTNNTGHVNFTFPNNQLKGDISQNQASIFLKKNDFEIGLLGKFDGTKSNMHLKEGNLIFDIGADVNNSNGYLTLEDGSKKFSSKYNINDSIFIKYEDGTNLSEVSHISETSKTYFKTSTTEMLVQSNPTQKSGRMLFAIPEFSFDGSFNGTSSTASLDFVKDNIILKNYFRNDSAVIDYVIGQQQYKVVGLADGSGSVYFADENAGLASGFGYNKSQQASSLLFQKGSLLIDIAANKSQNTGSVLVETANEIFHAALADSIFLSSTISGTTFSAVHATDKTGVFFSSGNNEIAVNKFTNGGNVFVKSGDVEVGLSKESNFYGVNYLDAQMSILSQISTNEAKVDFTKSDLGISASVGSNHSFNFTYADDNLQTGFGGNINDGAYNFAIDIDGWSGSIAEDIKQKTTELNIAKGNASIELDYLTTNKSIALGYGDIKIEGGLDQNKAFLTSTYKDVIFNAHQTNGVRLALGSAVASFTNITSQQFDFGLSFDSHSVQAKQVTLNGEKVFDLNIDGNPISMSPTEFSFSLSQGDWAGSIDANFEKKTSEIDINKGDYNLEMVYDESDQYLSLKKGNDKVSGGKKNGNGFFNAEYDSYNIEADGNSINIETDIADLVLDNFRNELFDIEAKIGSKTIELLPVKQSGKYSLTAKLDNYNMNIASDDFSIDIDEGGYAGSFKTNLETGKNTLNLSKGDYAISTNYSSNEKKLAVEYNGFTVEGGEENSNPFFNAGFNNLEVEVVNNNVEFEFEGTTIEVKNITSNSFDIEFLLGNKNFIISPKTVSNTYSVDISINGSSINLDTNLYSEIIGEKSITLEKVSNGKYKINLQKNNLVFNLIYEENKSPKIELSEANENITVSVSNNQILVDLNNYSAKYENTSKKLSLEQGNNSFEINENSFAAVFGNNIINISDDSLSYANNDIVARGSNDLIGVVGNYSGKKLDIELKKTGEISAEIKKDDIAVLMKFVGDQAPDLSFNKSGIITEYAFTQDEVEIQVADYGAKYNRNDNILEITQSDNEFKVSENLLALKVNDVEFEATPQSFMLDKGDLSTYIDDSELRVGQRFGLNKVTAILQEQGDNKLEIELDNHYLNIDYKENDIPQITYKNGDDEYSYQISDQYVGIIVQDYTAKFTHSDNKIVVSENNNSFSLSPDEVSINFDDYSLLANETQFKAEKGNYKTEISAEKVAVAIDDKILEFKKDKSFTLALSQDQNITATTNSIELNYNSNNLKVSDTEISFAETSQQISGQVTPNGASFSKGDYSLLANTNQLKFEKGNDYLSIDNNAITGKYQQSEFSVTSDKTISYSDSERQLTASEQSLALNYQDYGLEVQLNKAKLTIGTSGEVIASKELLSYNNGDFSIALDKPFSSPELEYEKGDSKLKLSGSEMFINVGDKKFEVAGNKYGIQIDEDHKMLFDNNNLTLKHSKYEAGFQNYSNLSLSDGVRSFSVSSTELEANLDDKNGIKTYIAQGLPGLILTKDGNEFNIGANGSSFTVAGFKFGMNAQNYIKMQKADANGNDGLYVNNAGMQYKQGDAELKIGTGNKVIELVYQNNKSLAFTKNTELVFTYDNSIITTIHKDLSVSCVKGDHYVGINKSEYMIGYSNKSLGANLQFKKFDDGIGIQASKGDYLSYVKGNKNADITVGVSSASIGGFEFTANSIKDITMKGLKDNNDIVAGKITGGKELKNLLVKLPNGNKIFEYNSEVDVMGETVDGIEEVSMNGPSHLSNISSQAFGWATAGVKISLIASNNPRMVMNGRVQTGLNVPLLCADAPFGSYLGKDGFLFKLADQNNRAQLKLICALIDLPPVEGFAKFEVKPGPQTSFNVRVGMRYRADFSSGFTVGLSPGCDISLTASMGAGFDFLGDAILVLPVSGGDASFALNESYVDLFAYASVTGSSSEICGGLSLSVSAAVNGRLAMKTTDNVTNVSGKASGSIEVGPINKGFDINVDFDI